MIINGKYLLEAAPIEQMIPTKEQAFGVSHGLSEVGYDIRVKQTVKFTPPNPLSFMTLIRSMERSENAENRQYYAQAAERAFFGFTEVSDAQENTIVTKIGRTAIASSVDKFWIPPSLWCEFRNKSTHARCFVDATLGTDGEPNWRGYLTIEIVFHDQQEIIIPGGSGILKAVFHELKGRGYYDGKYQDQADRPVAAIFEKILHENPDTGGAAGL